MRWLGRGEEEGKGQERERNLEGKMGEQERKGGDKGRESRRRMERGVKREGEREGRAEVSRRGGEGEMGRWSGLERGEEGEGDWGKGQEGECKASGKEERVMGEREMLGGGGERGEGGDVISLHL